MERAEVSQRLARSDRCASPPVPLKIWRPLGAVGTGAALLAGLFGLAAQAQTSQTWTGGNNPQPPLNWQASSNWTNNTVPTVTAIFPQVVPAAASIVNNSSGSSISIGTINFTSVAANPTNYTLTFVGPSFFVTGQGITGPDPAQAAATLIMQPGNTTFFQSASTGGLATFVIRPGGTLDLSNRNPTGLNTMTTGPMTNEGTVNLGIANVVGNTLTVIGNYTGRTGSGSGLIRLNTFLGTDSSPSD